MPVSHYRESPVDPLGIPIVYALTPGGSSGISYAGVTLEQIPCGSPEDPTGVRAQTRRILRGSSVDPQQCDTTTNGGPDRITMLSSQTQKQEGKKLCVTTINPFLLVLRVERDTERRFACAWETQGRTRALMGEHPFFTTGGMGEKGAMQYKVEFPSSK